MTKGICLLGKLNHWLGAGAARDGRTALYSEIDFCAGDICRSVEKFPTLVWDIGLFEWVERIQTYADGSYDYISKLNEFVDGGLVDQRFIDDVSKILSKGSARAEEDGIP